jgi:glutamate synthase domain-containing protein 3
LCGVIAERAVKERRAAARPGVFDFAARGLREGAVRLTFTGSAGQGFAAFLVDGVEAELWGEANDSVCKSMAGGRVVIRPHAEARFEPENNAIIGNGALYGATGGTLYVSGLAGDRFAVRNSGAIAVVEGVGLHACTYMTGGTVVILGRVSHNVAAGMTGGTVYLRREHAGSVNPDYAVALDLDDEGALALSALLADYERATGSAVAAALLADAAAMRHAFKRCVPRGEVKSAAAPLAVVAPA